MMKGIVTDHGNSGTQDKDRLLTGCRTLMRFVSRLAAKDSNEASYAKDVNSIHKSSRAADCASSRQGKDDIRTLARKNLHCANDSETGTLVHTTKIYLGTSLGTSSESKLRHF